jgi:glycosyltransferase involved in cell wall biosynthesis
MIAVAYHPKLECYNPYLRMYADALAAHGIVPGPVLETGRRFLDENVGRVQALHVQWNPDHLWHPPWAQGWRRRARCMAKFVWFLRRARRLGYKLVWTLHDAERHEGNRWGDETGHRLLARSVDLCICHDTLAADQFVTRFGGDRRNVRVMPIGNYDPVALPPRATRAEVLAARGLDPARPTFLCHGALRPYKRYDVAVEAFRRLGPGYQLLVSGVEAVPETVAGLRAAGAGLGHVRLDVGRTSDQELADLFAATDGLILPYGKITGSSALITAWTFGRGTISSDLPHFREMAALCDRAGLTFPVGNADGLAQAVRRFLDVGPAVRGRAARALADRFEWGAVVRPVLEWYRGAFPGRVAAAPPGVPTGVGSGQ